MFERSVVMFASREDAGNQLGAFLADREVRPDIVLGLPRGGVVVAAAVARVLAVPLDALVVRKVGHPFFREFAVGAVAENNVVVLDEQSLGQNPGARVALTSVLDEELNRLAALETLFHEGHRLNLEGKSVMLVDDGLATGATTEAAVLAARAGRARVVTVAAPVASFTAVRRLEKSADGVHAITVDPDFEAVGQYYQRFDQTSDEEVLRLLRSARTENVARGG